MKRNTLFSGAGILMLCSMLYAAVPQLINFQGTLKDGSGNPVANGSYSVIFTIYDAPAGGNIQWAETTSVTTSSSLFSVLLGSLNPVPDSAFNNPNRWLGIKVGADPEMTPRQQLVSIGFGYRVNSVDGALGGNILTKVSIGPGHINTGANAIAVGDSNIATGVSAFVAGANNRARGDFSVVSGGGGSTFADSNSALGVWSTIGGGSNNTASGFTATVGGGSINMASDGGATVGGGASNTASGFQATIGGGVGNIASGNQSTVGGGLYNKASSIYSTVPGGWYNRASGASSFAAGTNAKALHNNTFVWADPGTGVFADSFVSTGNGQFLIRAGGGVGIGTNSPAARLHVNGVAEGIRIQGPATGASNSAWMGFYDNVGTRMGYVGDGGGAESNVQLTADLGDVELYTAAGKVLSATSAGNVGIGTDAPAYKLDVAGSAHATSFPTSSDIRLKENIEPLSNVLEKIEKIRGVSFDWNETYEALGRSSGHREIGVIAQDVEKVFPELVSQWGDEDYRAVDYGRMTAVLIEAVKELKAENEELKDRISKLEKSKPQAQVKY